MDANQIEQLDAIKAVVEQMKDKGLAADSPILVLENWYPVRAHRTSGAKTVELKCRAADREITAEVQMDNAGNLISSTFSQSRQTRTGPPGQLTEESFTFSTSGPISYDGDHVTSDDCKVKIVNHLLQQASHNDWTEAGLGALMVESGWKRTSKKKVDKVQVRTFECQTGLGSVKMIVTEAGGVLSAASTMDEQPFLFHTMMNRKAAVKRGEEFGSW